MRRIASLLGFLVIVVLALLLLWRVYLHHNATDPYDDDNTEVACAKFATLLG